ncbi:MAG: hypothetical protein P1V20_05400 [Verrucomicrobiales bacterium]|nr:hypothetical protein [Verrucomicrobiales bacterium]
MEEWNAIYERISKNADFGDSSGQCDYLAEALESRVLYSGSPVDSGIQDFLEPEWLLDDVVTDIEMPKSFEYESEVSSSSFLKEIPVFLSCLSNLSTDEIAELTGNVINRGKSADLDDAQKDVIDALEISMIDVLSLVESGPNESLSDFVSITPLADSSTFSGSTLGVHPEASPDRIGFDLICHLLPELNGPVRLESLANLQIAKRTVDVAPESEITTINTLSIKEVKSLTPVMAETHSVVQVNGDSLGFGYKSQLFLDLDVAKQMGCITDSSGVE